MQTTKNGITLTYTGDGNSTVSAVGVVNEGLDTSTTFAISTTDGSISHDVIINQEGRREVYNSDFILKDGSTFNTIKDGYKDE